MPNDMYLVHPEHPSQRTPKLCASATRHQALRWPTFRAANGLISERRAHYRIIVARQDGRLGPQITRSTLDCGAIEEARRTGAPVPAVAPGKPLPCNARASRLGD